jgi:hypothetical protein
MTLRYDLSSGLTAANKEIARSIEQAVGDSGGINWVAAIGDSLTYFSNTTGIRRASG